MAAEALAVDLDRQVDLVVAAAAEGLALPRHQADDPERDAAHEQRAAERIEPGKSSSWMSAPITATVAAVCVLAVGEVAAGLEVEVHHPP